MDEDEAAIDSFFDALLDDKTEKRILKLLRQGMDPEMILETLLSDAGGEMK